MKTQGRIIAAAAILSILVWGCAKNDSNPDSNSLKQSITGSSANLNKAMEAITSSPAYTILTVNDGSIMLNYILGKKLVFTKKKQ